MKKTIQLVVMILAFLPAISFAQAKKSTWPELKSFHALMAATFHPAEEGNLAPLKAKADSLLSAVDTWQKSPVPSDFKPAETQQALKMLEAKCRRIKKIVAANGTDQDLKRLITEAHDIFHTIVGECRKSE